MNVLITGASGFIGGRLASYLLDNGVYKVRGTGRSQALVEQFSGEAVECLIGDLSDVEFTNQLTKNIDVIVHCAGLAGTWGDYQDYYQANVLSTQLLADSAKKNGVMRFINISSPSIYLNFEHQLDVKEDYLPAEFSNHYARTKYEAEVLVQAAHSESFQTISLRPRMVIGAGDNNIFPRLLNMQKQGLLKQVGDGQNIVSMTSIQNLLVLIEQCFDAPSKAMGRAYNVSNAQPEKLWEVIDQLFVAMEMSTKRPSVPFKLAFTLARCNAFLKKLFRVKKEPGLLPVPVSVMGKSMTLNIDEAKMRLHYQPTETAHDSVEEFISWWKAQSNKI
ncbi:hypothetical protein A3762_12375 [Oleiphilus sp. HI0125]|uniref:NAD-dependent epimerase/dehydratase family protein n=1 Tax=Oleiphilus sp. HI0125 TaxID=1822266 RepID=UPI0007C384FF|nr:NAD-dependent epimerase/dehydratase family protein [Oleiphilus sp. HI0125]KZZ63385.1 hypothetical protein A3762_12375 [Oleiphilus sp. HI0125]